MVPRMAQLRAHSKDEHFDATVLRCLSQEISHKAKSTEKGRVMKTKHRRITEA
jgi:hypothetical protein